MLTPTKRARVRLWQTDAAAGTVVDSLWSKATGGAASRDARDGAAAVLLDRGGVADLAMIYAPGFTPRDRKSMRDRSVSRLVSQKERPTFACGAVPIPDVACDDVTGETVDVVWPQHAYARPFDNLFVERGLRNAGADAVADWLRNATVTFVAEEAADGGAFYYAYDGSGTGVRDSGNASVNTAAVVLILSHRDLGVSDTADAPVSRGVLIRATKGCFNVTFQL